MTPSPAPDAIADLLLRHHRDPARFGAEAMLAAHTFGNLDLVLRLALGRTVGFADARLRGAGPQLERAAAFFIRQRFFRDAATHYDVLGVADNATPQALRENFRLLMQLIHPDRQGASGAWPESCAARANLAYAVLKSPSSRAEYDRKLALGHAHEARAQSTPQAGARAMPARTPPRVPARSRTPVPPSVLPEWWTSGVGSVVRDHPALTAFTVLIVVAALTVVAMIDFDADGRMKADAAYSSPASGGKRTPERPTQAPAEAVPIAPSRPAVETVAPPAASRAVARPAPEGASARRGGLDAAPKDSVVASAPAPAFAPARTLPGNPEADDGARLREPALPGGAARAPSARPAPVAVAAPSAAAPALSAASSASAAALASIGAAASAPAPAPAPAAHVRAIAAAAPQEPPAPASASRQAVPTIPLPLDPPVPAQAPRVPPEPAVASAGPAIAPAVVAAPPSAAASPAPSRVVSAAAAPLAASEIEMLVASFVSSYEKGRLETLVRLFDDDALANDRRGRVAIAGEYEQLFRSTAWRRMAIAQLVWRPAGERTEARGELTLRTAWRDGREVEQRVALDMELTRQGGRPVISRLSLVPR